ncbi:MAG TPA: hypothetical protein VFQ35_04185 [Polyangiaceae bacterium]|nr:hypothetical protein [Polyangiaceae bacterium]
MGADLLSSQSSPSRLVCRRGRWTLELTRLVAVDNHVFQPRKQRIDGSDLILSHLKRSAEGATLAQGALQLMRAARGDDERSFEAIEGEWVPVQENRRDAEVAFQESAQAALAELRAELLILRASHQRLKERVVSLEARLAGGSVPAPRQPAPAAPGPDPVAAQFSSVGHPNAGKAAASSSPLAPEPAPLFSQAQPPASPTLATGQDPEPARPYGEVVAAAGNQSVAGHQIATGDSNEILNAIKELCGGDPGYVKSEEPLPDSALELAALYASLLVDDDGQALGAVLADIRATAGLGGKLAGLPPTVIEEQAKTGVLNEAVTSAMSEVCNTVSSVLSRVPRNGNLRSTPLESFPADRLRWVNNPSSVVAFEKRRAGVFWIVTR